MSLRRACSSSSSSSSAPRSWRPFSCRKAANCSREIAPPALPPAMRVNMSSKSTVSACWVWLPCVSLLFPASRAAAPPAAACPDAGAAAGAGAGGEASLGNGAAGAVAGAAACSRDTAACTDAGTAAGKAALGAAPGTGCRCLACDAAPPAAAGPAAGAAAGAGSGDKDSLGNGAAGTAGGAAAWDTATRAEAGTAAGEATPTGAEPGTGRRYLACHAASWRREGWRSADTTAACTPPARTRRSAVSPARLARAAPRAQATAGRRRPTPGCTRAGEGGQ